ncbi:MAG TPA: hypothetical protein VF702_14745 [Allosphingosinicella sp.]
MNNDKTTVNASRIPFRLAARELTQHEIAHVAGGGYTKTYLHGEMGDYVSP